MKPFDSTRGGPGTCTQLVRVDDGAVTTMENIHRFSSPAAYVDSLDTTPDQLHTKPF
jgi:hypothetical protein